jgi:hypothetical protein
MAGLLLHLVVVIVAATIVIIIFINWVLYVLQFYFDQHDGNLFS